MRYISKKIKFKTINEKLVLDLNVLDDSIANHTKDDEINNLLQSITVKSYNEFIDKLTELKDCFIEVFYALCLEDGKLIVATSQNINSHFEVNINYVFECAAIEKEIAEIYKLTEGEIRIVSGSISNGCNMGPNVLALKLILAHANTIAHGRKPYYKFYIPKKDGSQREIIAPDNEIKSVLKELNVFLNHIYGNKNTDCQFAYKNGMSIVDNAKQHRNHKYIYNMDIENFFPNCKREYVRKYILFMFKGAINRDLVIDKFLNIILYNDALFIGNPVSGVLANTILMKASTYLKNVAKRCNMEFSIYADDMTFSSDTPIKGEFVADLFKQVFSKYELDNFNIKESKSYGRQGVHRHITGVSFSENDRLSVSRKYFRSIRAMVHNLSTGKHVNIQSLKGKIAYAVMVDETDKLGKYLDKYRTTVKKYNLISEDRLNNLLSR